MRGPAVQRSSEPIKTSAEPGSSSTTPERKIALVVPLNGATLGVLPTTPNSNSRLGSQSTRGGLSPDHYVSMSSSSSPPMSPVSHSVAHSAISDSSNALTTSVGRISTAETKRVLSLDEESRDSSRSKDGDDSEEHEPLSPLADDVLGLRVRGSSRRASSARNTPFVSESDAESSSSSYHSSTKRKRRSSQRSAPARTVSSELGYASESTVREEPTSHSPIHRIWAPSSTGPVPLLPNRDRSASRSESPADAKPRTSSRNRARSEFRTLDLSSSESRTRDTASQDDSLESSRRKALGKERKAGTPPPTLGHHIHSGSGGGSTELLLLPSASHLGIPSAEPKAYTRKKSKRPSKNEMLALHGVWAYERDGKMQIFGGSTSKIIGQLLDLLVTSPDRDHIYSLVHIFLHGARQFYNAAELLSVLLKYWDLQGDFVNPCSGSIDVVRSSIIFFLAAWFEKRFLIDFANTHDSAKPALEKFMRKLPEQYVGPLQAKLKRYTTQEMPIPSVVFVKPLVSSTPSKLSLLDIKPVILAGQWTLLDMRNFQNIQLSEFYAQNESGERPEWSKMLRRSEAFTKWLALSIVQIKQLPQRVKALKRTINLAVKFLELNNFNGLMSTWGALNTLAVHRLAKTFKKLPKSSTEVYRSLEEKLSESNNFANLRWSIHKHRLQGAALIPWFELIAKNRNLLDEFDDVLSPPRAHVTPANRDTVLYSFSKFAKLADQIEDFLGYQHNNRNLDLHSTQHHISEQIIQSWLTELDTSGEEELWQLSIQCEPLDASTGDSSSSAL